MEKARLMLGVDSHMSISELSRDAMTRFEKAVRAHAFKWASTPEDHEEIELEYLAAKIALRKRICVAERTLR